MSVIIGGSGSTGSSLFKNLLNNHPRIFGGIETNLFAKLPLYKNWNSNKTRLTAKGLRALPNHSWHYFRGLDLLHPDFGWENEELQNAAQQSNSFQEFTDLFFRRPMDMNNAEMWIEKTPSNAACFSHFLRTFDRGKVIHMTRNPYDTMSSLLRRGIGLYYATGIYLLNTAAALAVSDHPAYLLVKYENLVEYPKAELKRVCRFLGVAFTEEMLEMGNKEARFKTKLRGWKYDEMEEVKKGSVGSFFELPEAEQNRILTALDLVHINWFGQSLSYNSISGLKEICRAMDYEYIERSGKNSGDVISQLRQQRRENRWFRLKKADPKALFHPLSIRRR
jgi:hypothetical protein